MRASVAHRNFLSLRFRAPISLRRHHPFYVMVSVGSYQTAHTEFAIACLHDAELIWEFEKWLT